MILVGSSVLLRSVLMLVLCLRMLTLLHALRLGRQVDVNDGKEAKGQVSWAGGTGAAVST